MRKETSLYYPFVISITKNLIGVAGEPDQTPFLTLEGELIRRNDYNIERKGRRMGVIFRDLKIKEDTLVGGQIGLQKDIQLHVDNGEVITNELGIDWPWIRFFWFREKQQIIVQSSFVYKFSLKAIPFAKLLSAVFEVALGGKYYVNVRPMPEEGELWRVLENSEKVYFIEFDYISPNIAGATAAHVKGLLDHFKVQMNSTDSSIRINNKDGELEWDRNDEYLGAANQTVEKTGGGWKVRNERGVQTSRQVIKKMTLHEVGAFVAEDVLDMVLTSVKKE